MPGKKEICIFWFLTCVFLSANHVPASVLSVLYELPHLPSAYRSDTTTAPSVETQTQKSAAMGRVAQGQPPSGQRGTQTPLCHCDPSYLHTLWEKLVPPLQALTDKSTGSWARCILLVPWFPPWPNRANNPSHLPWTAAARTKWDDACKAFTREQPASPLSSPA